MRLTLQDWTRQEVAQRIALQLNAREKSERLGSALQQADDWLAVAESSGERIQDLLSINTSMSPTGDTTLFDQLLAEIRSLRTQLATATEIVSSIHDRITETSDEASPEARFEQAARFTVRVVATLTSINSRFDSIANRVTVAQRRLQELKIVDPLVDSGRDDRSHAADAFDGCWSGRTVLSGMGSRAWGRFSYMVAKEISREL